MFEIITGCGAKIQAGKLTKQEKEIGLTYCPIECLLCHKAHGLEFARSIKKEAQPKKIDVVEEMDRIDRREEA